MKRTLVVSLALTIAVVGSMTMVPAQEPMPPTDGEAFWTYITEINPYTKWKMWPGREGMYPGRSPHGAVLMLYVNDKAYDAIQQHRDMPSGAIIVKENYDENKETLLAVTPMYKVEGYNPDAGDWFWAKYGTGNSAKPEVQAAGKVEGCINCHTTVLQQDYLFTGK